MIIDDIETIIIKIPNFIILMQALIIKNKAVLQPCFFILLLMVKLFCCVHGLTCEVDAEFSVDGAVNP